MGNTSREAEIDQLNSLFRLVKEDVLEFDIPMSYIALVAIVDRLDDLPPEELGLKLWHLAIRLHFEVPVQAASIHELHDEEDLLVGLEDFEELCDVLVIQLLHYFHLAFDALSPVGLHQLGLLVDLDCDLLVKCPVQAKSHDCIRPLANSLANEIAV